MKTFWILVRIVMTPLFFFALLMLVTLIQPMETWCSDVCEIFNCIPFWIMKGKLPRE